MTSDPDDETTGGTQREDTGDGAAVEGSTKGLSEISDRIYCLEAGAVICTGPPNDVRSDPRVVASYLGTDEQAIARSGAAGRAARRP